MYVWSVSFVIFVSECSVILKAVLRIGGVGRRDRENCNNGQRVGMMIGRREIKGDWEREREREKRKSCN